MESLSVAAILSVDLSSPTPSLVDIVDNDIINKVNESVKKSLNVLIMNKLHYHSCDILSLPLSGLMPHAMYCGKSELTVFLNVATELVVCGPRPPRISDCPVLGLDPLSSTSCGNGAISISRVVQ